MLRIRRVALATSQRRAVCGAVAALLALLALAAGSAGRVLYNGVRLPAAWPPAQQLTREPMAVPYLKSPPAVIPIDVPRADRADPARLEVLRRSLLGNRLATP